MASITALLLLTHHPSSNELHGPLLLLSASLSPAFVLPSQQRLLRRSATLRSVTNMDPMPQLAATTIHLLYQRSVVQILAQRTNMTPDGPVLVKKTFLGSGFIIHRNPQENSFLVITCRHVITGMEPDDGDLTDILLVRLPGTTVDIEANHTHVFDDAVDLQVVSVHVPPEILPVTLFPCVRFDPPAPPVPLGALVAMMGYYNPVNLPLYLGFGLNERLFSTEPSAYGGYIVGPEDHTATSGIIIQHSCYGIRGASGGPLIRYDTRRAIGVFSSVTGSTGESISTECVRVLLGKWLEHNGYGINPDSTIDERIDMCAALY